METIFEQIANGFVLMINHVDWLFVSIFILSSYLLFSKKDLILGVKNINIKVRSSLLVFMWGVVLAIVFYYFFRPEFITGRDYFKNLFITIIFSMSVYKFGIDKILDYFKNKFFINKN